MNDSLIRILLFAAVALPLFNALAFAIPGVRLAAWNGSALAALPALVLALIAQPGTEAFGLVVDETGRIFLGFTAALWFLSGWFTVNCMRRERHRVRFDVFFLLSMAGNFLLILARDIPTFYAGFALMGFASAGLVLHRGDSEALRAGRLYIALAVFGEVMLFVGFGHLAAGSASLRIDEVVSSSTSKAAIMMLLIGFGCKAGALSLHFWLPLAHPTAPVPASAVLSGAMIKAGIFGWIRFLPLGLVEWPDLGITLIVLGLLGALLGVAAGVTQGNPKTVLAYSSLSQIGIMMVAFGVAFLDPASWPALLSALIIYAAHHGLAKGALFLAVLPVKNCRTRWHVCLGCLGLLLPALALAGAPFSSGAVAKLALKEPIRYLPGFSAVLVGVLLPLAATGTTLLMIRYLSLAWPKQAPSNVRTSDDSLWIPWGLAVLSTLLGVWFVPGGIVDLDKVTTPAKVWASAWPVLAGIGLALSWHRLKKSFHWKTPVGLPAGDVVVLLERLVPKRIRKAIAFVPNKDPASLAPRVRVDWLRMASLAEQRVREGIWVLLAVLLLALLLSMR